MNQEDSCGNQPEPTSPSPYAVGVGVPAPIPSPPPFPPPATASVNQAPDPQEENRLMEASFSKMVSSSYFEHHHHHHPPHPSGPPIRQQSTTPSAAPKEKATSTATTRHMPDYSGQQQQQCDKPVAKVNPVNTANASSTTLETIEKLLVCYLENNGGVARSLEFRYLVEAFLSPIFENLHGFRRSIGEDVEEPSSSNLSPFPSTSTTCTGATSHYVSAPAVFCIKSNAESSSSTETNESGASGSGCSGNSGASTSSSIPIPIATSSNSSILSSGPSTSASMSASNSLPGTSASALREHTEIESELEVERVCQAQGHDSLSCPACYGVLIDPVTIPCGHSYCKKCLRRETIGNVCRRCKHILTAVDISQCKTNVLLGSLVEKWWKKDVAATSLRNEGNALFEEKKVDEALEKYSEALNLAPNDHLSLSNRSLALLTAGRTKEALEDAESATQICPVWTKGYFRKSVALISLGKYEEAFLSLTVCMYLMRAVSGWSDPIVNPMPSTSQGMTSCGKEDSTQVQVLNEMIKILEKLFFQLTSSNGPILKRHINNNSNECPNINDNFSGSSQLRFSPYPIPRNPSFVGGRFGGRRRGGANCVGNSNSYGMKMSSGFMSSGGGNSPDSTFGEEKDEKKDHQFDSICGNGWRSPKSYQPHQRLSPNRTKARLGGNAGIPTSAEHLSVRINRLFTRAMQELKTFEDGLNVSSKCRSVDVNLVTSNDMECSLCYRLLYQPVSTGCGHTFCRSCLDRCLDHNPSCPLCKTSLQSYLASREHTVTEFLESALKQFFPKELEERHKQHMEELNSAVSLSAEGKTSNLSVDIPIFVCTMAFPTVPCPLHVFEPRYRLMIRRCTENGSNRFGMCCYIADNEYNYGDIGTLLEIKNIQYFADGRSVVDTVGCRRFKVIRKTVIDGYNAARIELVHDRPIDESNIPVVNDLHDRVFKAANEWLQSIGQVRRQRIHSHFGQMPPPEENWLNSPDGPSWTWWLLAILPLDSKAQLSILSMSCLQKRLECILKVLAFVKNRMGAIGE